MRIDCLRSGDREEEYGGEETEKDLDHRGCEDFFGNLAEEVEVHG